MPEEDRTLTGCEDLTALAAGALTAAEAEALAEHARSCPRCRSEEPTLREAAARLAEAEPRPALPAATRQQVLDLARVPPTPIDPARYTWEEIAPGIRAHVVAEEPERGFRGALVWADPGATHPRHRHRGDELILVLAGGLADARGEYRAGEICHSRTGSIHTERVLPGEECFCYVCYYGDLEMLPE